MKPLRMILMVGIAAVSMTCAQAATLMEEKLNIERSIQERAERLVEKIIGTQNMVVLVNVDLQASPEKVADTRQQFRGMQVTEEEYLPGVTYAQAASAPSYITPAGSIINSISVVVTLDAGVTDEIVKRIKDELFALLGLNPLRKDSVNVRKISFAGTPNEKRRFTQYLTQYAMPAMTVIAVMLGIFFLFGPLSSFLKAISAMAQAQIKVYSENTQKAGPAGAGALTGDLTAGLPGELEYASSKGKATITEEKNNAKHFGFVTAEHMPSVKFLMKNRTAEELAVMLHFLSASQAAELLQSQPPDIQAAAAAMFADSTLLDAAHVKKLENELLEKLDFLTGGTERFQNVFDRLEREAQSALIAAVEANNKSFAHHLRNSIVLFEDILKLDKPSLLKVIRACQRATIAMPLVLKTAPDAVRTAIMDVLTEGARAMMAQQMDFLGATSEKRAEAERNRVVGVLKDLSRQGEIEIPRTESRPV